MCANTREQGLLQELDKGVESVHCGECTHCFTLKCQFSSVFVPMNSPYLQRF